MNYYERHIGDYLKDTAHLSLLEHGIYARLLDVYYTREGRIPERDIARLIGARSKDERDALASVLSEFFQLVDGSYTQARCEREIARFQDKQRKAKASAETRWSKTQQQSEGNANAMRTHSEGNADALLSGCEGNAPRARPQTPDTRPSYSEANASGVDPPAEDVRDKPAKTRAELWRAGKSLLAEQGMPKGQCGSFVGKLVADYGDEIVVDAVRAAVMAEPAEAREYLIATCQRLKGERKPPAPPLTVPSNADKQTAVYIAQQAAHAAEAVPPPPEIADIRRRLLSRGLSGHFVPTNDAAASDSHNPLDLSTP